MNYDEYILQGNPINEPQTLERCEECGELIEETDYEAVRTVYYESYCGDCVHTLRDSLSRAELTEIGL